MVGKRALINISNVRTNDQIGHNIHKPVKRVIDLSPNKCIKKKNKILDENENQIQSKKPLTDPTLSIERKVKAIDIRCQPIDLSPLSVRQSILNSSSDDSIVSKLSDQSLEIEGIDFYDPSTYYCPPIDIPDTIEDFDKTQIKNIDSEPQYANDVFIYYKKKEIKDKVNKYLESQPELNKAMRSVLIDWMVEVQESFELNHETLYLSVKIIDNFLMRQTISKTEFQLLGATALLIAAKFDERIPPAIEDFIYICDDAYNREDVIAMEMRVLRALDFNLCYPISYRFLRRYARCAKLSMETLTLARYVLEMSLMEYEIIEEADSRVAAAALLLALKMKGQTEWNETLEFYSGYKVDDISILMYRLNDIISTQTKTKTIRNKYSHKIFFEVAKISPLPRTKPRKSLLS